MKPIRASRLMLALAFAGASFAASAQTGDQDHGAHHPDATTAAPATQAPPSRPNTAAPVPPARATSRPSPNMAPGAMPPAYSVPALQQRMKSIRDEKDPAHRLALIEEQIRALEAATQAASAECPMRGGMMQGGMMHGGMMPGSGQAGAPMDGARPMPPSKPGTATAPMTPPGPEMMREHMRMMERHMNMMEQMMRMHGQMHPEPAAR
ncbi:MAG: hypothetical protein ROZ37_00955 [Aromatoleum sp.]|uniref:hypothetical protein n=1 Tax=Aromatoleum sp. TaxID=2307007 RepID=UPI0028952301|nr:hypothetical protein [Aromatoleum sp.]MDT3668885.1 hypothetical protein [Aromatoleum sp.]